MRTFLDKVTIFIGHNIVRWDIPHLERLLGIKIKSRIVDTLPLSWTLFPQRRKHGLEEWGIEFGVPKPAIDNWLNLELEEYVHRCEEDVKINTRLWNEIWIKLKKIYKNEDTIWKYIKYLTFKMQCAQKAERDKWKLDVPFVQSSLEQLEAEVNSKVPTLQAAMPKVPVYVTRKRPAKMFKKDNSLSSKGQEWLDLLEQLHLPPETLETRIIHHYDDPNPGSTDQIKNWLYSLGWKPKTFKTVKNKETGEEREVEQINLPFNQGICSSVRELYEKEPSLELIEGLGVLSHRISILRGFLETVDEEGYVKATIQGLTNTLRFKHGHPCVNLPKPEKPYAQPVRASLIAPDGYELCGADKSSLEDRIKQHFIYPYDPEYVKSMMKDDFDPHLDLALLAGQVSEEQVLYYKKIDHYSDEDKKKLSLEEKNEYKRIKSIRSIFKNGNYALI